MTDDDASCTPRDLSVGHVLSGLAAHRKDLECIYKDLHQHPELAFSEHRTASLIANYLRRTDFTVHTKVGGTGVVGVLPNGDGPTLVLRADIDALPLAEDTGLDYTSTEKALNDNEILVPVSHSCGHDMHITWLLGASKLLSDARNQWRGRIVVLFQPAEETLSGARTMLADGLIEIIGSPPDAVFAQHLAPLPTGVIASRPGPVMAAADGLSVILHGRGGHGAQPDTTIDPVVLAAAIVLRLQTVTSREVSPSDIAVVTVGYIHAGTSDNVIPETAELKINLRTFSKDVRQRVRNSVRRIIIAEANASGVEQEPSIHETNSVPVLFNDETLFASTMESFAAYFGPDRIVDCGIVTASEDCGLYGDAWMAPTCYWFVGGTDSGLFEPDSLNSGMQIPTNHSPQFAPQIQPTLDTGIQTFVVSALTFLPTSR